MNRRSRRLMIGWILAMVTLLWLPAQSFGQAPLVLTVQVESMITAGTAAHIQRAVLEAEAQNAAALVLVLNTPGGLVDATLDIISVMAASEVPIITYVAPQGAIAASAGAFILLGGHIAAMSPGTTTGAAMPVMLTPDEEGAQTADNKTILFLAGHIRSIAESNDRPADVAERFVTENLTLTSREALDLGVIEYSSSDLTLLLETVHGKTLLLGEERVTLDTAGAQVVPLERSLTERITHLISNPQITFILLLIGIYGLIIGLNNPGTFVPEVLGAICLVLALYGLGMFEINLFAVVMIVLGIGLLVAEALTPTYGVLGTGGVISLVVGIIYLPFEPLVADRWLAQFRLMAIGIGAVGSLFLLALLSGLFRIRKLPVRMGATEFAQDIAKVTEAIDPEGFILVRGELWKARSQNGDRIPAGEQVRIIERKQLVCFVTPVNDQNGKADAKEELK